MKHFTFVELQISLRFKIGQQQNFSSNNLWTFKWHHHLNVFPSYWWRLIWLPESKIFHLINCHSKTEVHEFYSKRKAVLLFIKYACFFKISSIDWHCFISESFLLVVYVFVILLPSFMARIFIACWTFVFRHRLECT